MEDKEHQDAAPGREIVGPVDSDNVRTIVVNGREHRFAGDRIGHGELATLAYPSLSEKKGRSLVASFGAGPAGQERGVVAHGGKVDVVEGQQFDVRVTDRS
jgi:hypothetical protein